MYLEYKIGTSRQGVEVDEKNLMGVLEPNKLPPGPCGEEAVKNALAAPIGARPLRQIVHKGETVAIVTSDITRPMPTHAVMPALLDELYAGGVAPEDITLVFALGSHRGHSEEEKRHLAGERAWAEIHCVDLDAADCVHIGTTSRGTPCTDCP